MAAGPISEDTGYVNIHGQDVRVFVCEKTGQILIPIDELKNMGFRIYKKDQYNRLMVDAKQFNKEFHMFMLQAAQNYMFEKKVVFNENTILESINKCKEKLSCNGTSNGLDDDSSNTKYSPVTRQNLNHHNYKNQQESIKSIPFEKTSCDGSTHSTKQQNKSFEDENKSRRSPAINNKFSQPIRSPYKSFEQPFKEENRSNQLRSPRPSPNQQDKPTQEEKMYKRLESITLNKPEHTVIVSHVERDNILWVQDVEAADTLLEIDNKITEEVSKNSVTTKYIFNKIYLGQYEHSWFRCKIIKFKPLTMSFVDYGNLETVDALKEASDELSKIPAQAVKIILPKGATAKICDTLRINNIRKFDTSYNVEVVEVENDTPGGDKSPAVFFTKPTPMCKLEHGQKVMVVSEVDGKLLLRTKECYDKLKQIEKALANIELKQVEEVDLGQVVLCKNEDKIWRAVVSKIQGDSVEVTLLDYSEQLNLPLSAIHHITESLSEEPITYILTPKIKGLTLESKRLIEELLNTRVKPSVILKGSDFDLQLEDGLLSEKLVKKTPKRDVVTLQDMDNYKPQLGRGEFMLQTYRNAENVTISDGKAIEEHLDVILKSEIEPPVRPYNPTVGEVCFGLYQESWSRCEVQRSVNDGFEVKFVDFGNSEILKRKDLVKLTEDAKSVPILGIPCRLVGLPKHEDIEALLSACVNEGDIFEVDVINYDGRLYDIEVPALYKAAMKNI